MNSLTTSLFIAFLLLINYNFSYGQNCNCTATYEWMTKTFEENDAGYLVYLDLLGQKKVDKLKDYYSAKAQAVKTKKQCQSIMESWLQEYRSEHIGISQTTETYDSLDLAALEIKSWSEKELNTSIDKLLEISDDPLVGIWESNSYTIALIKEANRYLAYVKKSSNKDWKEGELKFIINKDQSLTYYLLGDKTLRTLGAPIQIANSILYFNNLAVFYKKDIEVSKSVSNYLKQLTAKEPFFDSISPHTNVLSIPNMWYQNKKVVDSLLVKNESRLKNSAFLIIDIRGNGGGSDFTYEGVMPLLYTNPIRQLSASFRSTKANNAFLDMVANEQSLEAEVRDWAKEILSRANLSIDAYVPMDTTSEVVYSYDQVLVTPQKVAILVDENVASAAEQFLLDAKQSTKVKVYGKTTAGALDMANVYEAISPCEDYILSYALSKSDRIPDLVIDEIGVQPDYFLDKNIPVEDWLTYVSKMLEAPIEKNK